MLSYSRHFLDLIFFQQTLISVSIPYHRLADCMYANDTQAEPLLTLLLSRHFSAVVVLTALFC
jgi:hypothetical protein